MSHAGERQARAPESRAFGAEAFAPSDETVLRWLGMAGFVITGHGVSLALDPVLSGFDLPLLFTPPIAAADIPALDAVLVTHADNDHFSLPTCRDLAGTTVAFHSTRYVAGLMADEGLPACGHEVGDRFSIGPIDVLITPADHAWQNGTPGASDRVFALDDCCGFWLDTPDGSIWAPGDSRLIPQHHLAMPAPDALLFDFSDSEWHFGLAGAVTMANAYPDTPLLLHHWGSVDAPELAPFNGDPEVVRGLVDNPGRIVLLAPGEPFRLTRAESPRRHL